MAVAVAIPKATLRMLVPLFGARTAPSAVRQASDRTMTRLPKLSSVPLQCNICLDSPMLRWVWNNGPNYLEKLQLPADRGWAKCATVQLKSHLADSGALAGKPEPGAEQFGPDSARLHPGEEAGIVVASAADRADDAHHLLAALGKMDGEPLAKQRGDFVG